MAEVAAAGGGGRWKKLIGDGGLVIGMLLVQMIATGLQLLTKLILNQGSFVFAYIFYRHIVAAVCIAPFALYFERAVDGVKVISWAIFFWLFTVALTGSTMGMALFYYGLRDTTATYGTNFQNLIPIITFLFSTILGIEKLEVHTRSGKIKILGAALCLGGAVVITIYNYKGKDINMIHHPILVRHPSLNGHIVANHHWARGTIFLVGSCLFSSLWYISQAKLYAIYPYKFRITFYSSLIASLQQLFMGLCINRSKSAWQLKWNLQLITIFYSGALATAMAYCLISWAVAKRGPTFPAMFNPLSLIFVTIAESLFLCVPISSGSLIGMALTLVGIYIFLWAKSKEIKGMVVKLSTNEIGKAGKEQMQAAAVTVAVAAQVISQSPNSDENQLGQGYGNQVV